MIGYSDWSSAGGAATFDAITWLVVFIDLVLLGLWLWKQVKK